MGFGILLIPLMDTLRVFGIRIIHGRSPFSPDRNHIHHWLIDIGMSHKNITLTLASIATAIVFLTYFSLPLGTTKVIVLQIITFFAGIYVLYLLQPKSARMKIVSNKNVDEKNDSFVKKVVLNALAGNRN
jgi:UDP-GlcNAc:undecaprenyl-phosphate/decaprenyl-phosphate GlcNAc-1-phosphate transferase